MRYKKFIVLALATVLISSVAEGQNKSYQEFREEILSGYNRFRQKLLDNYADFLKGEWHEYESLNGENRYKVPKPSQPPHTPDSSTKPDMSRPLGGDVSNPVTPADLQKGKPDSEDKSEDPRRGTTKINFFELPVMVPKAEFNIMHRLESNSDYARQWQLLNDRKVASNLVPRLLETASDMRLNDYFVFQLVKTYVESAFPDKHDSSRFSAIHYLLANMGYDVRIAYTDRSEPLLLIPFDRTVYGRAFIMVDDCKYYIFAPNDLNTKELGSRKVYTCNIPSSVGRGNKLGLVVGEMNIPYEPYKFELKGGGLSLTGEVNRNLMGMLYRYPQMGVDGFAMSIIQPSLRNELVTQIKSQIEGMNEKEAVDALLQFTQHAFDYATDDEFHGFEKPYFLEESLFYPKNDCEDRAIFFTYFVWNALGIQTQLISYPGHEAASVSLEATIDGKSFIHEGRKFYISDPTYIGATTGMVMPSFRNEKPKVDYTYRATK